MHAGQGQFDHPRCQDTPGRIEAGDGTERRATGSVDGVHAGPELGKERPLPRSLELRRRHTAVVDGMPASCRT